MSKPCPFMAAFLFLILAVSPVMGHEGLPALIKKVGPSIVVIVTYIQFDYAEGHLDLGAAYFHTGCIEETMVSYKQAIRLKPSLAEAHPNLGMSYLRFGDKGSAIEEYKILKGLDQEPGNRLFNLIYE